MRGQARTLTRQVKPPGGYCFYLVTINSMGECLYKAYCRSIISMEKRISVQCTVSEEQLKLLDRRVEQAYIAGIITNKTRYSYMQYLITEAIKTTTIIPPGGSFAGLPDPRIPRKGKKKKS